MDAEVSTHTFLTMIIEESVCFMSCEPFFLVQLFLCGTYGIYFYLHPTFFSSIEQCTWAIISRKSSNLGSCPYHLHYCTGKQNYLLSNILWFTLKICFWANVTQLILVKIKWHIKWKYLIQKFHDIYLSYYFNIYTVSSSSHMKLLSEKILTIFNRHNFTDLWTMELFENIALMEIMGYGYGV